MEFTREYFTNLAKEISETGSHPEVVHRMDEVRRAPPEERIMRGTSVYPEELEKLGVPVPDTMRVIPRTFERPEFARTNGVQKPGVEPGSSADTAWQSYGSMEKEAYDGSTWGKDSEPLPDKTEDREVIREAIYNAVIEISDFVLDAPFYAALTEMYDLQEEARYKFVLDVFLNEEERNRRNIVVPEQMSIQRSTFYDGRPTLFCIAKKEMRAYPWRKITITFDNDDLNAPVENESNKAESLPAG